MIDLNLYIAFTFAALLIISMPGPSVSFVIARSINLGIKGGILSCDRRFIRSCETI